MRTLDLSSWHGILTSLLGLALFALIGVGIRVLLTLTIQQRRERANRQINERLKVLIAAYKALGGSFTGTLSVDPTHLRELRQRAVPAGSETGNSTETPDTERQAGSDRSRRIRDAVEAALSDILLLGTEQQVRLAAEAVSEMVGGKPIHTAELVVSLRDFIRKALDLDPIPQDLKIPLQGPARPGTGGGRSGGKDQASGNSGGKSARGEALGSGGSDGFRLKEEPPEEEHHDGGH